MRIQKNLTKLIKYSEKTGFQGSDPYDGFSSLLFKEYP